MKRSEMIEMIMAALKKEWPFPRLHPDDMIDERACEQATLLFERALYVGLAQAALKVCEEEGMKPPPYLKKYPHKDPTFMVDQYAVVQTWEPEEEAQ